MNNDLLAQNPAVNRQITLASRPTGTPRKADFKLVETGKPLCVPNSFLCRTLYLSIDPYMRGRMNDAKSYAPAVELGSPMIGGTISEVTESKHDSFPVGSIVLNGSGWQDYSLSDGTDVTLLYAPGRGIKPQHPLSYYLGILGMPGLTAYVGLLDIGQPQTGETVVVSAATGAVGSVVGQLAKLRGCRVVGIAGTGLKCEHAINNLGFDDCVNHQSDRFNDNLKTACPDGIDIYFESVGGKVLEAVLPLLNPAARIPLCGGIAYYNLTALPRGGDRVPVLMRALLVNRVKLQGFIVTDHSDRREAFVKEMNQWIKDGVVTYREDFVDGLVNAPSALITVLEGGNFGKQVVRVSREPILSGELGREPVT